MARADLDSIIASWRVAPFARGSTDCCAFVDFVVEKMTGKSRLPQYDDDETALAIIEKHGSLENAVTSYLNAEPVARAELQAGDIALVRIFDKEAIGVLTAHDTVAIIFEEGGLRVIRDDFVDKGWRVWA